MPKNNKLPVSKRRKIKQAVERYQGDGLPHTVQDSLPFEKIYPDGLCKLSETKYSRCIEFEDINFRLVSEERQNTIIAKYFNELCLMNDFAEWLGRLASHVNTRGVEDVYILRDAAKMYVCLVDMVTELHEPIDPENKMDVARFLQSRSEATRTGDRIIFEFSKGVEKRRASKR